MENSFLNLAFFGYFLIGFVFGCNFFMVLDRSSLGKPNKNSKKS